MSGMVQTSFPRQPQDLSHLVFQMGNIGRLTVLDCVPVVAGDSFEDTFVGAFKLSALRRNLSLDPCVDILSFYIPHRHIYGDDWIDFMKAGPSNPEGTPSQLGDNGVQVYPKWMGVLGLSSEIEESETPYTVPKWRVEGYNKIFNNYFKRPDDQDLDVLLEVDSRGLRCAHLKNLWSAPLNRSAQAQYGDYDTIDVTDGTLSVFRLTEQVAALHGQQEKDYFDQRYRDVMKNNFGGSTTADVDQRPTMLNRQTYWASGYDVDGTSEVSLGQYTGRVDFSFNFKTPRKFIPEHGAVWTVAVVRYPSIVVGENHFLSMNANPTYEEIAGDPLVSGNAPVFPITDAEVFSGRDIASPRSFDVAHDAWYREHPSYVHSRFGELQGFPFLNYNPAGILTNQFYISPSYYDSIFQSSQTLQWSIYARSNARVIRRVPSARDSIMQSE